MKPSVKYAVIYHHRTEYPVIVMCNFFAVSRSGYYSFVSRLDRPVKDAELIEKLVSSKESVLKPMDTAGCGNG